ncbi:hypothetical protein [Marinactinospora rubrisoli]|uniref:Uncharacterized protein n=1 Tax=Marinactinospora rubrisoli TaxID=2715399 RepID=A0ABW2KE52_9ACTN
MAGEHQGTGDRRNGSNGSCQGGAWVRVYARGIGWSNWVYHASNARIDVPSGNPVTQSQHKGCQNCRVYTLTP